MIGAIGMALIARDRVLASGKASRFRGFDLQQVHFTSHDFVCRACSNYCEMKDLLDIANLLHPLNLESYRRIPALVTL